MAPAFEQPLLINSPIVDSLASGFEKALYRFDGTPGQRLYFDSLANASGNWYLYSPTNQYINGNSLASDFEVTLPDAGSYTLMVFGNNYSSDAVNYNFKVTTPPTNILGLNLNAQITGEIAAAGEVDIFTFNGTTGTTLYYDALEIDGDNILATLVTPSGNKLLSRYNAEYDSSLFTLTETGTYRLIFDGDSSTTGDYKFQLLAASSSDRLNLNQMVEGQLFSSQQTALYQFNGTAGQQVVFAPVDSLRFGSAQEAAATAKSITTGGGEEDGYAAIDTAISHNGFRPNAARNVILITDEDRDISETGQNFNFSNILDALNAKNVLLNAAVGANFANSYNGTALGVDAKGNAYTADGAGSFTLTPGGRFVSAFENTKLDYIDLAWATGGIAWDLYKLREGGITAASFSQAFTSHLVKQIESQFAIDVIASDNTVNFTNSTGVLNGIKPGETANFTASFTGDGNSHNFDLLFVRPGTNTILGSIPVTINSDKAYFYPVQAIDPDGDELTYSLTSSPNGATIDAKTGRVSWQPTSAGNYTFEIGVSDSRGGVATQTYQLLVKSGGDNTNPEITSIAPTNAAVGQTYNYQVTATDIDSDRLSFYLVDPPDNALIDKDTGLLTWTPSAVNETSLTVKVLDSRGGVSSQTFTVTVKADVENQPPQFNSAPIIASTVGQTYRYDPIVTDPNADRLQFDLAVKPEGMTLSTETGVVVWQPNADQVGKHNVVLRVFDGRGGVDLQSYQVNVEPSNHNPAITSLPPLQATVNRTYQYPIRVLDADGDSISFRLENAPNGMLVDEKGILTWTPTTNYLGTQQVNIIVSDGNGGEAKQTFNLNVLENAPNSDPIITSTPRNKIGLDNNYFYQIEVNNTDGDPLTYSLETHPVGMSIDSQGRVFWKPTAAQFGNNNIKIKVDDGRGGIDVQEFVVNVVSTTINTAPSIDSTPSLTATVNRSYEYNLTGSDPDNDPLLWSLDTAPPGMSIDPEKGVIRWTPTAQQVGEHEVAVRVMDSMGAYVGQIFTITVRGVNVAPTIISTPPTTAAVNQAYKYAVLAKDLENDSLKFSLLNSPSGMTINRDTGLIDWMPTISQLGEQNVEVIVEDSWGEVTKQSYKILVKQTAENLAPSITSTPPNVGAVGQVYEYAITATDPEGEVLQYQLLDKPLGMTVDSGTGIVRWMPTEGGVYSVTVGAIDGSGVGAAQQFELNVAVNQVPQIVSTPVESITLGKTYRYDVKATDGNGDALVYSLTNPVAGMKIDSFGRISWSPSNTGDFPVNITVTDSRGASVSQVYNLSVVADNTAPKVSLWSSRVGSVDKGELVSFVVSATDDVGVSATVLRVNNRVVSLDSQGRATVRMDTAGVVEAVAVATDVAGNVGSASNSINVVDFSDTDAPILSISSLEDDAIITAPIDIIGTVNDSNLSYYRLLVSPIDGGEFREVFRGTSPVTDGVLAKFDPSVLGNDSYVLRLEAADTNGNVSSVERVVNVAGELKLGNFRLSFTDLSIPVAGIGINVTRTYDSLDANSKDDFGYGWRLDLWDTDLRTSVPRPDELEQEMGIYHPFKEGTRVYVTLPGGKREGFTFKPRKDSVSPYLIGAAGNAGIEGDPAIYHPEFVPDKGVTSQLSVEDAYIIRGGNTNQFYGLYGVAYNPSDPYFGGKYKLTTKDGVVCEIDGYTGDLVTITDTNGNKLTFSEASIKSDTGKSVTFGRDAQGRITSITDFDGKQIKYQYDANSDLVAVTDREDNTTTFEYLAPNRSHFLTEINDPLGRPQVRTEYDEKGRLKKQLDVNGKDVEFIYDPDNFTHTVLDVFDKPITYIYDERGNILQEIDAKGGITTRTYDEDNNLLSETDPDGVVTKYTYDSQGNTLTIEDGDNNITRMTYGPLGRVQSIVSPTGLTASSKYDRRGNLIESTDTNGLTTKYTYNSAGLLTHQVSPDGQTTEWGYDTFGNPNRIVDSRGNEVKAIYDPNGRVQNATTQFSLNGQTYNLSTSFTYDKEGRILSNTNSQGNSQSTIYNSLGQITSTTDILGNVTSYIYDNKGRVTEITLPDNTPDNPNDNPKISKKYDAADRLIEETSTTGLVTKYVYDELGRLTETVVPDLTPNNWDDNPRIFNKYTPASRLEGKTDIFGNWENFEYDNLGRLKREKDVLGNYTSYTYNKGGQLTSITDPRLRTTHFTYDDKARLTETLFFDNSKNLVTYDSLGRVATSTNELGQTTRYEYDPYSQIKAIINPQERRTEFEYDHRRNLVKVTDALGQITRYEYDSLGRQIATIYHNGDRSDMQYDRFNRLTTVTDENRHTTKYSYNNLNQLTSLELANFARTNYTYDNLGRLKKVEDANHNFTEYEYDAFNRTTATVLPLLQRDQTVYDKFGQVKTYTDFNGDTINYTYDPYGRLNRKFFTNPNIAPVDYTYDPVTSQMLTVTDGRGETKYTYDNRERLQSITQPDGKKVEYGYDVLSNLTSLTTPAGTIDYTYDSLNRLDKVKQGAEILADYDYNKVGNLEQTLKADGTVETRQYDPRNRLTNIQTKNTVGNIISSYTYTLDGVGNRKRVVENTGRTVDYTYDEVDRLTEEKITDAVAGNRTLGYSYDLVGNRKSRNDSVDGLTNYTYDANDRLLQTTQEQFTYDNNGSLKTRVSGTSTTTYDWINDGENRLVGVTSTKPGSTSNINYIYDAAGNRVASIADGVRTNYLVAPIWNLPQVLNEYDGNGQVTSDYTYGLNLIRSRSGGNEKFYHTDGLGSTRMLTDTTGLITDRYNYDAFGVLLSPASTSFNPYQFAGERRDSSTGLDYLRARYYDSSLGRFVSKDAFSGFLDDPMSQHDYQYAHANPVVNTDPTGYFTLGDVLNTITTASQLALIGSTSFAGGYMTAGILSGANAGDVLQMVSDFAAGFASGISGGFLTDVYESYTGQKVEARHGVLWGAGNIAGISSSFLLGMKLPSYMTNTVSPTLKWTAVGATGLLTGFDVYGAAQATVGLADGKWEWQDAWNLLAYVPFVGMFGSLKRGFGATRDVPNPVRSINGEISTASNVSVKAKGNTSCFVAGTEILTTEGEKDIEDIEVGDWVIADDPTTPGEIEAKQVLETFVRETDGLVDLYVDGEVISTTGEHPFWVPDKGWVEAKDLTVGSLLQTEDGKVVDVDKVEKREGKFEVYNFKVEGFHTYFVSDLGVLVHNANCNIPDGLHRGDINSNIAGGVPTGYEGHHLISVSVAQQYEVMRYAATNLGYNINRANNGIALPGRTMSTTDVLATGLPYHGGRHQPGYNELIIQRLSPLERDYKAGLLDDAAIMNEITRIENQMRSDLINDNVRLQRNDPRP